jgi:GNAT superfamily N-acetyltransferase
MFADIALAAEIDRAEGRLCAEIAEGAAVRRPAARPLVKTLSGGVVGYAGPGAPSNKAIAVGLDELLDENGLAAIEEEWRSRGEPMRIELATLAQNGVASLLTARGYRLLGFENVLGCGLDSFKEVSTGAGLTITTLEPRDEAKWFDVMGEGFAIPDAAPTPAESYPREVLEEVFADLASTRGFVRYLAWQDGRPVGAASLRLDGTIAQLCGAATLPGFRRRGVQTGLLQRRLADARHAGCTLAVVTTQPGSKSQANSQRRGFELLYARAVLVREWA